MPRPNSSAPNPAPKDPALQPLRPGRTAPLAGQAYDSIKSLLFRGHYQQGEHLRVEVLCDRLGTSRQPVMDALKRLGHEGYLTIIPQVGCLVRTYSRDEVRDYYRLYAAADGLLAELAAQRAPTEDMDALEDIAARIERLIALPRLGSREGGQYRQLNREFHQAIRHMAASPPVAEIASNMNDQSDFFTVTMRHTLRADRLQLAHAEHSEIIAALRQRDAHEARAAMVRHIDAVAERLWEQD